MSNLKYRIDDAEKNYLEYNKGFPRDLYREYIAVFIECIYKKEYEFLKKAVKKFFDHFLKDDLSILKDVFESIPKENRFLIGIEIEERISEDIKNIEGYYCSKNILELFDTIIQIEDIKKDMVSYAKIISAILKAAIKYYNADIETITKSGNEKIEQEIKLGMIFHEYEEYELEEKIIDIEPKENLNNGAESINFNIKCAVINKITNIGYINNILIKKNKEKKELGKALYFFEYYFGEYEDISFITEEGITIEGNSATLACFILGMAYKLQKDGYNSEILLNNMRKTLFMADLSRVRGKVILKKVGGVISKLIAAFEDSEIDTAVVSIEDFFNISLEIYLTDNINIENIDYKSKKMTLVHDERKIEVKGYKYLNNLVNEIYFDIPEMILNIIKDSKSEFSKLRYILNELIIDTKRIIEIKDGIHKNYYNRYSMKIMDKFIETYSNDISGIVKEDFLSIKKSIEGKNSEDDLISIINNLKYMIKSLETEENYKEIEKILRLIEELRKSESADNIRIECNCKDFLNSYKEIEDKENKILELNRLIKDGINSINNQSDSEDIIFLIKDSIGLIFQETIQLYIYTLQKIWSRRDNGDNYNILELDSKNNSKNSLGNYIKSRNIIEDREYNKIKENLIKLLISEDKYGYFMNPFAIEIESNLDLKYTVMPNNKIIYADKKLIKLANVESALFLPPEIIRMEYDRMDYKANLYSLGMILKLMISKNRNKEDIDNIGLLLENNRELRVLK